MVWLQGSSVWSTISCTTAVWVLGRLRSYEFAKLLHSIEGKYDFIIKDLFDLDADVGNNFRFKILDFARTFDLKKIFLGVFKDELKQNIREVRLIEALLFFSMIPLHKENIKRQYAMLCTAMKLLNELAEV